MKKSLFYSTIGFSVFAILFFILQSQTAADSTEKIILFNLGLGCGIKAAGLCGNLLFDMDNFRIGIHLIVSALAFVIMLCDISSYTMNSITILLYAGIGVSAVFILDAVIFIEKSAAAMKQN